MGDLYVFHYLLYFYFNMIDDIYRGRNHNYMRKKLPSGWHALSLSELLAFPSHFSTFFSIVTEGSDILELNSSIQQQINVDHVYCVELTSVYGTKNQEEAQTKPWLVTPLITNNAAPSNLQRVIEHTFHSSAHNQKISCSSWIQKSVVLSKHPENNRNLLTENPPRFVNGKLVSDKDVIIDPFQTPPFQADTSTVFILSLERFKKWYYQFNDSLYYTFKEQLGLHVKQVYSEQELLRHGKPGDVLIALINPIDLRFTKLHITASQHKFHIIMYETESMQFRRKRDLAELYGAYKPEAIWTYSMFNVDRLMDRKVTRVYYVPPSYSPSCDYSNSIYAHTSTLPVTFVERWVGGKRVQPLVNQSIPFENVHAWSHSEFAQNVSSHTILINVHKSGMLPVEMFRLAPVLSSGMHVISEHSYEKDEELLAPFVTFKDVENMSEVITEWIEEGKDKQKRIEIARHISAEFKKKFNLCSFVVKGLKHVISHLSETSCP